MIIFKAAKPKKWRKRIFSLYSIFINLVQIIKMILFQIIVGHFRSTEFVIYMYIYIFSVAKITCKMHFPTSLNFKEILPSGRLLLNLLIHRKTNYVRILNKAPVEPLHVGD